MIKEYIIEWWWNFRGYVRCLHNLRVSVYGEVTSTDAYCKRRSGHKGYHQSGNTRLRWKY